MYDVLKNSWHLLDFFLICHDFLREPIRVIHLISNIDYNVIIWYLNISFCECMQTLSIHLNYVVSTCGCSYSMNSCFSSYTLSLLKTFLTFFHKCSIICNHLPYQMYPSLRALRYGSSTACIMRVWILFSTPKNILYLMTFWACFLWHLLQSNEETFGWIVSL